MYVESWLRISCPGCGKTNWVYQGDPDDLTSPSSGWPETFACWKCKKAWGLVGGGPLDADDGYDEGLRKPEL